MDEEKAIEQFAKDLERCQEYADIGGYQTDFKETARSLCYEGYRKAEEVRKETAKWFIDFLYKYRLNDTISKQDILNLAEKYGIEVGE